MAKKIKTPKVKKIYEHIVIDPKNPKWIKICDIALETLKKRRGKFVPVPVQRPYRSLYKPAIPSVSVFEDINVNEKMKAFFRVDDLIWKEGRIPYRLYIFTKNTLITTTSLNYRVMVHTGKSLHGKTLRSPEAVGHRLGEFFKTKWTGSIVHADNKTKQKLRKRMAQLRITSQKRKQRKKKVVSRPTHNKKEKQMKHGWVKKQTQEFKEKKVQKNKK